MAFALLAATEAGDGSSPQVIDALRLSGDHPKPSGTPRFARQAVFFTSSSIMPEEEPGSS